MPSITKQPCFQSLFPGYAVRSLPIQSSEHQGLASICAQVRPDYYPKQMEPQLKQHLLYNEESKVLGTFFEPQKPGQATMSLYMAPTSTNPQLFCLLALSTLFDGLRYRPSSTHPIIIRGKEVPFIQPLRSVAQALGIDASTCFSNRATAPQFFKPAPPPGAPSPLSPSLMALTAPLRDYCQQELLQLGMQKNYTTIKT